MSVRPEFGPTLPELLAARGISRRAMAAGVLALVALAVAAFLVVRAGDDSEQLVVAGPPVFNLVYAPSALHEAPLREDELARLEGRRRNLAVELTARPLDVPPYERGDVVGGYLPLLAERRIHELEMLYGPVQVHDEGKSRINRLPGYQIGFEAQVPEGRLFGRDAYVLPDEERPAKGVLLSVRRVIRRRQTPADSDYFDVVKEAFSSFNFGESQP